MDLGALGDMLKAARLAAGHSQREQALLLGVPDVYPSRWERGVLFPTPPNLVRLVDLYGLDSDKVLRAYAADLVSRRQNGGDPPGPRGPR